MPQVEDGGDLAHAMSSYFKVFVAGGVTASSGKQSVKWIKVSIRTLKLTKHHCGRPR